MADVILFRDTFDGPAGPVDETRVPEVGVYDFLTGTLDGAGQLLFSPDMYGALALTPILVDAASTYTATAVFGGSGASNRAGFGLFTGDDLATLLGLLVYVDASDTMYLTAGTPGGLVETTIGGVVPDQPLTVAFEISQTGAKASLNGAVGWSSEQLKVSDVASMPLKVQVGQMTSSALTIDDLILVQTTAAASSLPPGFNSSWEAAQEVAGALPAPGWSVSEDFLGGANAPTGARPVTAQVGVSGATWTSFKRDYWN